MRFKKTAPVKERIQRAIIAIHKHYVLKDEGAIVFIYGLGNVDRDIDYACFASTREDRCDLITALIEWIARQSPGLVEIAFDRFKDIQKHGPEIAN